LFVVVGLGNPGERYKLTRHNIGFMVIDRLADLHNIRVNRIKHKALEGEGIIGGERVVLVKPQTYMNNSGLSVLDVYQSYNLDLENLIVVYDDMDIDVGMIRIRPKGSAGSHNGMKSVIYHLNTDNFPRIRIGIGRRPEGVNAAEYVLSPFRENELPLIKDSIERACKAVETIITDGIDKAMNKFN